MAIDPDLDPILKAITDRLTALESLASAIRSSLTALAETNAAIAARLTALEAGAPAGPAPVPDPDPVDPGPFDPPDPPPVDPPPVNPPPPVTPGTGLTNPSIGMNVGGMVDWSVERPFLDVLRTARHFVAFDRDKGRVPIESSLDATGWPVRMPAGADYLSSCVLTDIPENTPGFAGTYRVRTTGRGTISFAGRPRNVRRDGTTYHFDYTPGPGLVALDILSTDPADPLRILDIVHTDHIAVYDAGERWHPDWLAMVRDWRLIRAMDWGETNNSPVRRWSERSRMDHFTWTVRGVPLEMQVATANRAGADLWVCIPHMADDDYIERAATLVRDMLDPKLHAYFEYSNECWNWMFDQAQWCNQQGRALWPNTGSAWVQYYAGQSVRMAKIVDRVFASVPGRALKVISTQTGWQGLETDILNAPQWTATDPERTPPKAYFDVYAVTGYFGHELGNETGAPRTLGWLDQHGEAGAMDRAFDALTAGIDGLSRSLRYHKGVADAAGLRMVMYEGGSHVVAVTDEYRDNDRLTDFFGKLHLDPRMGALYTRLLDGWKAAGGAELCIFANIGPHSKWGPWGHWRYAGDRTPRGDALIGWNAANPAWWEARPAGTFLGRAS